MELGLLSETGADVASVKERPTFVSFPHKLLQEFAAARFIARRLERVKGNAQVGTLILLLVTVFTHVQVTPKSDAHKLQP